MALRSFVLLGRCLLHTLVTYGAIKDAVTNLENVIAALCETERYAITKAVADTHGNSKVVLGWIHDRVGWCGEHSPVA